MEPTTFTCANKSKLTHLNPNTLLGLSPEATVAALARNGITVLEGHTGAEVLAEIDAMGIWKQTEQARVQASRRP